jgi:hypothetical protein
MFGSIMTESVVQVGDKVRIDCTRTFATKGEDAISALTVNPDADALVPITAVDITGLRSSDWFLDWSYDTAGEKLISLGMDNGASTTTLEKTISVVTAEQDRLFSSDSDLFPHEPDIAKWVPAGKSSHNYAHRKAQLCILDWLDSLRIWKNDGSRLTKNDLPLSDDLRQLSTYLALGIIFASLSNSVGDIFEKKQKEYESLAESVKTRGRIQADFNGDGKIDEKESQDLKSMFMVRR